MAYRSGASVRVPPAECYSSTFGHSRKGSANRELEGWSQLFYGSLGKSSANVVLRHLAIVMRQHVSEITVLFKPVSAFCHPFSSICIFTPPPLAILILIKIELLSHFAGKVIDLPLGMTCWFDCCTRRGNLVHQAGLVIGCQSLYMSRIAYVPVLSHRSDSQEVRFLLSADVIQQEHGQIFPWDVNPNVVQRGRLHPTD
jgi:hypothetical protein